MRAARWHGRNDVRVETVPDPTPGPGDVVIRVGCCGVCGTDLEEYRHGPIWVPVGEPVAVVGCGAVGLLAIQAARAGGAGVVFAVERSPARKALARQVGAAAVFDPEGQDVGDELRRLTGGGGAVPLIESAGAPGRWVYPASLAPRGGRRVE